MWADSVGLYHTASDKPLAAFVRFVAERAERVSDELDRCDHV